MSILTKRVIRYWMRWISFHILRLCRSWHPPDFDDESIDEIRSVLVGYDTLLISVMLNNPATERVHQPERERLTPLFEKINEIRSRRDAALDRIERWGR